MNKSRKRTHDDLCIRDARMAALLRREARALPGWLPPTPSRVDLRSGGRLLRRRIRGWAGRRCRRRGLNDERLADDRGLRLERDGRGSGCHLHRGGRGCSRRRGLGRTGWPLTAKLRRSLVRQLCRAAGGLRGWLRQGAGHGCRRRARPRDDRRCLGWQSRLRLLQVGLELLDVPDGLLNDGLRARIHVGQLFPRATLRLPLLRTGGLGLDGRIQASDSGKLETHATSFAQTFAES